MSTSAVRRRSCSKYRKTTGSDYNIRKNEVNRRTREFVQCRRNIGCSNMSDIMWLRRREGLPTYACLLITFTGLHIAQGFECRPQAVRSADNTIKSILSPHTDKTVDSCQWEIKASVGLPDQKVYVRIYFTKPKTIYRDCTKTYVDILDGSDVHAPVLGRWCDMNSTLIISSGAHVMVMSSSAGMSFEFEILYCLDAFQRPDTNESSLSQLEIAGIAISSFLVLFVSSCVVKKFCNPCSKRQQRTNNNHTNDPPYVVTFSRDNRTEENLRYMHGPPDYWTAVASGNMSNNENESLNEQPPSYSDVIAAAPH